MGRPSARGLSRVLPLRDPHVEATGCRALPRIGPVEDRAAHNHPCEGRQEDQEDGRDALALALVLGVDVADWRQRGDAMIFREIFGEPWRRHGGSAVADFRVHESPLPSPS